MSRAWRHTSLKNNIDSVEEHLVTSKLVIDKLLAMNVPIWIVSLDLSKPFDRVDWNHLWASTCHTWSFCTPDLGHAMFVLETRRPCPWRFSHGFAINSGVRQGCVLSPPRFSCMQQWAMRKWRSKMDTSDGGIDLADGLPKLLDFRFADYILLCACNAQEPTCMLNTLVGELAVMGLPHTAEC